MVLIEVIVTELIRKRIARSVVPTISSPSDGWEWLILTARRSPSSRFGACTTRCRGGHVAATYLRGKSSPDRVEEWTHHARSSRRWRLRKHWQLLVLPVGDANVWLALNIDPKPCSAGDTSGLATTSTNRCRWTAAARAARHGRLCVRRVRSPAARLCPCDPVRCSSCAEASTLAHRPRESAIDRCG